MQLQLIIYCNKSSLTTQSKDEVVKYSLTTATQQAKRKKAKKIMREYKFLFIVLEKAE